MTLALIVIVAIALGIGAWYLLNGSKAKEIPMGDRKGVTVVGAPGDAHPAPGDTPAHIADAADLAIRSIVPPVRMPPF